MRSNSKNRKAQVTLFIILGIVIVASVGIYFLVRENIKPGRVDPELSPVYAYFQTCIKDFTNDGIKLMGSQGGYIYVPEFSSGSDFAPFSSQLNFLGFPVPYWYYIAGNGVIKEQVPTKQKMQEQLSDYINMKLQYCDFTEFQKKGFIVEKNLDTSKVGVDIQERQVKVSIDMPLTISKGETTSIVKNHEMRVESEYGKFYNLALEIYDKEKQDMFLENYGVDVLRLYAPVDGVELSCSPLTWSSRAVMSDIRNALEANIQAIKVKGNYYDLSKDINKYFVIKDLETDNAVNFFYFADWPTQIEITPTENGLLNANPVGTQEGLGTLGFCYVPYHFVYDVKFPVLIQIYDPLNPEKLFQFPVAIIIDKNVARNALQGSVVEQQQEEELCRYKNTEISVFTYNSELNPIEADISFICFDTECSIGKTKIKRNGEASLLEKFPQCVNGFVSARAEDYISKKYLISTNKPGIANILMKRLYELDLKLSVDGKETRDRAIIHFTNKDNSVSLIYPDQDKVKLSQGSYNISVYVYRNSSLSIPGTSSRQCVETDVGGIFSLFNKKEECFDLDIPGQIVSSALAAGGRGTDYITESQLKESKKLKISAQSLPTPNSLEQLQDNYNLFETRKVYLQFEK